MTTKTYTDYTTIVDAASLNDFDAAVYQAIGDGTTPPTTAADVRTNLGLTAVGGAALIGNTAAGNIVATTVQAAIDELDTEKAAVAQVHYIGTTSIAANRASGALVLTGITSIDGNAATATTVANIAGGLVGQLPYQTAVDTTALLAAGTAGQLLKSGGAGAPAWQTSRTLVQVVQQTSGTSSSGSQSIPFDDTIPAITEGDEYLSLSITPVSASSLLEITVTANLATSAGGDNMTAALFINGTTPAIAAQSQYMATADRLLSFNFTHAMSPGTTSAMSFRVRAGISGAGTTYFNSISTGQKMGGVMSSSIIIKEYLP